jgi:hypothetical protein
MIPTSRHLTCWPTKRQLAHRLFTTSRNERNDERIPQ